MYCSRAMLVDENLESIGYSKIPGRGPSFENALVENIAIGCTTVLNSLARDIILISLPRPNSIVMHDWWAYMTVSALGQVFYDVETRTLYRQHSGNVVGLRDSILEEGVKKIKRFIKYGRVPLLTTQAREFREIHGELLSPDKKMILDRFVDKRNNLGRRIHYALRGETHRQTWLDNIIYRTLVVLNRI